MAKKDSTVKKAAKQNADSKGFQLNETQMEDEMAATQIASDQRWKTISGLLVAVLSFLSFVSFCSYSFTWRLDQDKVFNASLGGFFNVAKLEYANTIGSWGAFIAHWCIYDGVGIAAYFWSVVLMAFGINLMRKNFKLPTWSLTQFGILTTFWLTTLLSFVTPSSGFAWGGAMGDAISSYLTGFVGAIGTGAILFVGLIIYLVAVYNLNFEMEWLTAWLDRRRNAAHEAAMRAAAAVSETAGPVVFDNAFSAEAEAMKEAFAPSVNPSPIDNGATITYQGVPADAIAEDASIEITETNPTEIVVATTSVEQPELKDNNDAASFEISERPKPEQAAAVSFVAESLAAMNQPDMEDEMEEIEENIQEVEEEEEDPFEVVSYKAPTKEPRSAEPEFTVEDSKPEEGPKMDIAPKIEEKALDVTAVGGMEDYDPTKDLSHYKYPTLDLLNEYMNEGNSVTKDELEQNKNQIVNTLSNYGISIDKIKATIGPTVTLYEIVPAPGVRISKIKNLEDDIALSLAALGIRIIAPIPGKGTIGIEVPNIKKEIVGMRSLLASEKFVNANMELPVAIGKNIANENIVVDLAKMPHLLMAGATGQGKSVGLNALLVSLLYKKHPSQLKFVMVDPKKVELSIYKVIEKHFLAKLPNEEEPIITDTKKVVATLNSLCIEMDRRYDLLKDAICKNIMEYNRKFSARKLNPMRGHEYLPYIVVVIDEFADLIMTAGKEVEMPIARIAQLARAVGIHLIIATQRPSVNIITGTIKANFPARIAFKVSSKIDSRTILDTGGAEQLIGKGDMLLSHGGELLRVQCAFCDTPEIEAIVEHISDQQGYGTAHLLPEYVDPNDKEIGDIELGDERDEYFEEAAKIIVATQQGSTSMIQRKLKLGYNRAGRIMDQLEAAGIVGPSQGSKPREVRFKTEADLMQVLSTFR